MQGFDPSRKLLLRINTYKQVLLDSLKVENDSKYVRLLYLLQLLFCGHPDNEVIEQLESLRLLLALLEVEKAAVGQHHESLFPLREPGAVRFL